MINILIIMFLVAIVIGFLHILSMCKMIKDTDRRNKEIKQNQLKNKIMANAEPVRELKYKIDTGLCITMCPYILDSTKIGSITCGMCIHNRGNSTKKKVVFCAHPDNESFIKKVNAHFLEERKKQAESEKAGEK